MQSITFSEDFGGDFVILLYPLYGLRSIKDMLLLYAAETAKKRKQLEEEIGRAEKLRRTEK